MFNEFKIPKGTLDGRIKKNVMHRQALKKKWDRHCKYDASADNANVGTAFAIDKFSEDKENWVRLLDEGVVVEGDSTPYAVIGKGVIKKWFDQLPSNFEGYINKDHASAVELGSFKKSDLRIVETGDDRYGVDVNVKLDHELYATKDLLRVMNRKAISSEFFYDADEYVKASVATGDTSFPDWYLIPKISAISVVGYAVVDNPKNANSYDEDLLKKASAEEEGNNLMSEEEKKRLEAEGEIENEETEAKTEEIEQTEDADAGEGEGEVEQNSAGGAVDEEHANDTEADEGEGEGETETEDEEESSTEDENEAETETEDTADKLAAAIESLKAENKALKEENEDLKAKLSTKEEKEADFETKLKNVLAMASASTPTDEEGAEVTPDDEEKEKNSLVDSYKQAFKEIGE